MLMVKITDVETQLLPVLDKALAEDHVVIWSAAGALIVQDKALALYVFHETATRRAQMDEDNVVVSLMTFMGRPCIGFGAGTPKSVLMFGVPEELYTLSLPERGKAN